MNQKSLYPWLIWALAASFFFTEYITRVSPSLMIPQLMQAFQVGAGSLGGMTVFFYYAYVGMQIPVGVIVDRFGVRFSLSLMILVAAVGNILFASTHHLFTAEMGRFLTGLGAAFGFVAALKIAATWFPSSRFGLLAGVTQAIGMIGAAIGTGPAGFAVHTWGWREYTFALGIIFIVQSLCIFIFVRDKTSPSLLGHNNLLSGLKIVLKNPQTWINGLFVGLLYSPTASFGELWGANYLSHVHHMDAISAGSSISALFIGWGVGGPLMGWLSDRVGQRKLLMLGSALFSLILMALILYSPYHSHLLFFLYGVCNTGVVLSYALASEINPPEVSGTSIAFANMASVLVGSLFQPIIGIVLDHFWNGGLVNGIRVYSTYDYQLSFIVLPVCLLLSFVFGLLIREFKKT